MNGLLQVLKLILEEIDFWQNFNSFLKNMVFLSIFSNFILCQMSRFIISSFSRFLTVVPLASKSLWQWVWFLWMYYSFFFVSYLELLCCITDIGLEGVACRRDDYAHSLHFNWRSRRDFSLQSLALDAGVLGMILLM